MVSVRFVRRLKYPVTLAFVKSLVGLAEPPEGIEYIGKDGLKAIQGMALINRGRLSWCCKDSLTAGVQPVEQEAFDAIAALGDRGGFDDGVKVKGKRTKAEAKEEGADIEKPDTKPVSKKAKKAPKVKAEPAVTTVSTRRSSRLGKSK